MIFYIINLHILLTAYKKLHKCIRNMLQPALLPPCQPGCAHYTNNLQFPLLCSFSSRRREVRFAAHPPICLVMRVAYSSRGSPVDLQSLQQNLCLRLPMLLCELRTNTIRVVCKHSLFLILPDPYRR